MTAFIKKATSVYHIEHQLQYIQVEYEKYVESKETYETYVDHLMTEPLAEWVEFKAKPRSIPYVKFLDTMVNKTFEVRQRMAELALEEALRSSDNYVRIAHTAKILDPSFQPPRINVRSAWQKEFIKNFCYDTLTDLIERTCNMSRLEYFFNVVSSMQS